MLTVGQMVRVLEPFAESFPGEHEITEVLTDGEGQITYVLGETGGFAPIYVELVT